MKTEKKSLKTRRTWDAVKQSLPVAEQEKIEKMAMEIDREVTLTELLKSLQITQKDLAEKMHTTQPQISRMLKRDNIEVKTLKRVAESVDGELEISIRTKNGERVSLAV